MAAVRPLTSLPRRFRVQVLVAALVALALVGAAPAAAKNKPKSPHDSAVSQYVEVVPTAGGAKPSSGTAKPPAASGNATGASKTPRKTGKPAKVQPSAAPAPAANPVSAAFATNGGGLGGGTVLAIILGAIAAAGTVLFTVRRRLGRR